MREYEEQEVTEKKQVLKKVTCDKCGKEIQFHDTKFPCPGTTYFKISAGYGSGFDTMGYYGFEICDECTEEFFKTLKKDWREAERGHIMFDGVALP